MTDQEPMPSESPAITPAPLPLDPGTVSGPGRKRWPWVVGVLILLVLLGGCVAAIWLLDDAIGTYSDSLASGPGDTTRLNGAAGLDQATWTGDGAYAVIQYHRDSTYPSVAVWDRETGSARMLDGYRVLFVERFAPVVWMEPVTDEGADAANPIDGFGDALDHQPARLVAWKLDNGSGPTDNVPSKWRAWPGPGDSVAYLEINPLKGAAPSAVLFNNKASQGEGVKAEIPSTTGTFVPIGWSPSGRYFAVEELIDEQAAKDNRASGGTLADVEGVPRQVVVFDVATGKVSAAATLPALICVAPIALWDGSADRLFWLDSLEPTGDLTGIRSMTATGTSGDAFAEFGWDVSGEYPRLGGGTPLGWDPAGPLFAIDGDIWRITAAGPKQLGMFGPQIGSWLPGCGLLGVTTRYSNGETETTERPEAQVTDVHGGDRKTIWTGPTAVLSPK
jgi:hypothetical protein